MAEVRREDGLREADSATLSNFAQFRLHRLHLELRVEFEQRRLAGAAELTCSRRARSAADDAAIECVLDTRNIKVHAVLVNGERTSSWTLDAEHGHEVFGTPLRIALPESVYSSDEEFQIRIEYETGENASALQWIAPSGTHGGEYPFLFTQCQAIHARSLAPCFDTPAAKCPYSARIVSPEWSTALCSALMTSSTTAPDELDASKRVKISTFDQPIACSSYLIAIACGQLSKIDLSPRACVWSEPGVVADAASEFAAAERFLSTAEEITALPYAWTSYAILCLPPSFPYGGMENPCLTFVTPTLLAGDGSLADVVAHEIAHSWTGNLVTNSTWNHFWLNEGWTMWLQRKIVCAVKSKPLLFDLDARNGIAQLRDDIALFGEDNVLTALCPPLSGVDPDDAFSRVPYEKGFQFLLHIERELGSELFLQLFRSYLATFQNKTITSERFRKFVVDFVAEKRGPQNALAVDWDTWLYAPGMRAMGKPYVELVSALDGTLADAALKFAESWRSEGELPSDGGDDRWNSMSTVERVLVLERLLECPFPPAMAFCERYDLLESRNCELRFRALMLCLKNGALATHPTKVRASVEQMLSTQGRMKYTRPLYREYSKHASDDAKALFAKLNHFYHPICAKMVAKDLARTS
uniref:Peptidase M1 leukotriene A4 hydrolase/aminopeptidase C-terminal domain-containing protein n=1 Tax=Erythrolobus australicus TaxID=1077150 RepID=A0A7S1TM88_9RHOD